jgi:inorganic phosphate transporter, PiT family
MPASFTIFIVLLAFYYGYLTGQYGSASIVSTVISSRAMHPRQALLVATIGMVLGTVLLGSQVANTISRELITSDAVDETLVLATLLGAIVWSSFTLWLKIPVSVSQSTVGSLLGAAWAGYGTEAILPTGLQKVLIGMLLSPLIGMFFARGFVQFCYWAGSWATPHLNIWLQRGQMLASMLMALVFGSNDAQKITGILLLWIVAGDYDVTTETLHLLTLFSIFSVGAGMLAGGWRIIQTTGSKFYKIRPIHGFGAQVSSVLIIFTSVLYGLPISGSQVVTSAIIGAGSADRIRKVRWLVVQNIVLGWVLTLPLAGLAGAITYWLLKGLT